MSASAPAAFMAEVKRRREGLGLSVAEFGARLGMHRNNVLKIERGNVDIQLSTMLRLADALGVPLAELLGERVVLSATAIEFGRTLDLVDQKVRDATVALLRALSDAEGSEP